MIAKTLLLIAVYSIHSESECSHTAVNSCEQQLGLSLQLLTARMLLLIAVNSIYSEIECSHTAVNNCIQLFTAVYSCITAVYSCLFLAEKVPRLIEVTLCGLVQNTELFII